MAKTNGNTLVDLAGMTNVMGSYQVGKAKYMADPFIPLKAQEARRVLSGHMMAIDEKLIAEKIPETDYLVSRKLDGEFTLLVVDGTQAASVNPYGTCRLGLEFMDEAAALVAKAKHKKMLIIGELYIDIPDRRSRVHDVVQITRHPDSQKEVDLIKFAVFDILEIDGKPAPVHYADVYKKIESVFKGGKKIHPIQTVRARKVDEVKEYFDKWVTKEGAEGIVVRSDSGGMFKIKPKLNLDVAVLGFTEGTEERVGMIHDLLVGLMRQDKTFQILGRVGGGFSDDQRRAFLSDLKDMSAESNYAEINDSVAYQMVRPEWIIEMECLDLVGQSTRGATVDRMVLGFDSPANMYSSIRRMPLASVISPQFKRMREDKKVVPQDLRLQQVADVIEVPLMDKDARKLTFPRSEILKREVFTKTLKGALMVRKLVLWKTNKENEEDGSFPAFVAFFTDFSPNRATPLERDICISNSKEQIESLYNKLKEENIVKGWAPA